MKTSKLILSVCIMLTAATAPASGQALQVTLREAMSMALVHHPAMVQAQGDLSTARASYREAIGNWLPSLTGNTSWSANSSRRFDPNTQRTVSGATSTSATAGITASLELFDGFRRNAQRKASSATVNSARASLTNQEFQVLLQTKQAFYNALAADELVRVAEAQIKRSEEQLKVSRDKLSAGSAIRSDTLRSFVELGNSRLQLLNAQTQRATAEANLARLIGVEGTVRAVADSAIDLPATVDTAALRTEALHVSPLILQAEADASAAAAQVAVSRAQYFPSINASYSNSFSGSTFNNLFNTWSARISLSWPLFNGFTRETNMNRSAVNREAARARLEDTRRQVNAQLTQYFSAMETARIRLTIARASQEAAREDLRVQQERYRIGVSTIVDVLASQVNLDQAEVDEVQAKLDFLVAKAQVEALVGREI